MRSFHSIILLLVVVVLWLVPHDVIAGSTEFITTWRTTADNESITIPTHSESTYNYTVDWGDGSTVDSDQRGDASHTYTTAGTYVVMITGDFPRIYFDGVGDSNKIISIDQWGDIAWSSMESAFAGCFNLGYTAIDTPNLSKVNSMAEMFQNASEFNGNISNWVVSNVNDMSNMFFSASVFNQDIGAWDVGQVTDMNNMFSFALSFNQDIGDWEDKVGRVTDMRNMFNFALSFNQDIGMWKVSTVTDMSGMFSRAQSFNQDIGDWDVGQVTDMNGMFFRAQSFNQDIGDWDVGQVTDMDDMFTNVTLSTGNYDALLSGWSTIDDDESTLRSGVTFHAGSSKFCNIGGKGVLVNEPNSWVITDGGLATGCPRDTTAFITTWRTTAGNESITIPTHSGSTYSYNVDWGDGMVNFGYRGNAVHTYTTAGDYTVSITGDFPRIYFNNGGDRNKIISIDHWGDIAWSSMESAFEGCANLGYTAADSPDLSGVVSMASMFNRATVFDGNIGGWDVSQVVDMSNMFSFALSFDQNIGSWKVNAVTDMSGMFSDARSFNQNIGGWEVGQVTNMTDMFSGARSFNQNISGWEVGQVTNMADMFASARSFNQNIGGWEVGQVTDMNGMFSFAVSFNQNIGGWEVGQVTDMNGMFTGADSFNQDIGGWDVGLVENMRGMFFSADAFDQDIGDWDVGLVRDMASMFTGITLSTENYDALLSGWSTIDDDESTLLFGVTFHAGSSKFCNTRAKGALVNLNWVITDGGPADNCPRDTTAFITTWRTTAGNESITIPTHSGSTYNYNVDWGDGMVNLGYRGNAVHTYTTASSYTVSITGDFPRIYFNNEGDKDKIISIDQWGDIAWSSMESAFEGCANLGYTAIDSPDLSGVVSMASMFNRATVFDGNIGGWDVSQVVDMSNMFSFAISFNQNIGNWKVNAVTDMSGIFFRADEFDQNIGGWEVGQVTNMANMFRGANKFNGNISGWEVNQVTNMAGMFDDADSFNQNIGGWEVGQVTNMFRMFADTDEFDQNIGGWEVGQVTNMSAMFSGADEFDQNIGGWEVGQVTNMAGMFLGTNKFNGNISGWEEKLGQVTNMSRMFAGASSFNQDIGGWEVGQVTNMLGMFAGTDSFNQDIGDWDVGLVENMSAMFFRADSFNQDIGLWDVGQVTNMISMFDHITLSTENYDALLSGWSTIDDDESTLRFTVQFSAGNSKFCNIRAKGVLVNDPNRWVITDGGLADNCPRDTTAFITTWRTTADNESITIPTHSESTYSYNVNWGDGMVDFGYPGNAVHTYTTADTYTVSITGDFPRIYFNNVGDTDKIISIDHWGDIAWSSMESAFEGCVNLGYTATDTPDLSRVSSMAEMFQGAFEFNGNISNWVVSNVNNMSNMFLNASVFDQDIGGWEVGQVTNMAGMFADADSFNQNIGGWEVGQVTNMASMFADTDEFDQNIGGWEVGQVTSMFSMFAGADSFNQDIGDWDVGQVTNMANMFDNITLSTENYDALLSGWSTIDDDELALQSTIQFSAGNSKFCNTGAKGVLVNEPNSWVITDGGLADNCPRDTTAFITTWRTTAGNESITIPTHSESTYSYNVDWGDGMVDFGYPGAATHTYTTADTYTVSITGDFPRIYFNNVGDTDKIISIDQWGDIAWSSMESAFEGCFNLLGYTATDRPDLSKVNSMAEMFQSASKFNGNIVDWKVSTVTDMSGMFASAGEFNQDIGGWDVGQVTDMNNMFSSALSFNQNIGLWDVGQVADMSNMFSIASSFNQDIGSWKVSTVTDMSGMFSSADEFNQDIGDWDVGQVTNMANMFDNITLSTENYDALLFGWSTIDDDELALQSTVQFSAGNSKFCNTEAKGVLVKEPNSWVITDGGRATGCPLDTTVFITTWRTTTDNESITIPTHSESTYNYNVDWGDGMVDFGYPGAATHTYTTAGTYTVSIIGDFPRIYFNNVGDKDKIISIDQWGDIAWSSMESAFEGCANLGYTATDSPDLSGVASMASMFNDAAVFDGNIGGWDVGPVSDMTNMFASITLSTENYDALLSGWSIIDDDESTLRSGVTFHAGNSKFCNIGGKGVLVNLLWIITDGGSADNCPRDTTAFITTWRTTADNERITIPTHSESTYNYNVDWGDGMVDFGSIGAASHTYTTAGTYTVSITGDFPRIYFNNVGDKDKIISIDQWGDIAWSSMESAFEGCANLGYTATDSPDLSGVASMASMFNGAAAFDGNIGDWNVSKVTLMSNMFNGANSFNQDISDWKVGQVTNMGGMFADTDEFDQDISDWKVGQVTDMGGMFADTDEFDQNIGGWEVGQVTNMSAMFSGADEFDQDIGDWDVGQVTNMVGMFRDVTLSTENYDALLSGWSTIDDDESTLRSGVTFYAGSSKFCNTGAKGVLVNEPNSWVITDGGSADNCPRDTTAFITTWRTTTDNESITIPTHSESTYSYNVDWGDGMVNFGYTGAATHTYITAGTYTVSITGDFPRIYFNNEGDKDKIISIDQWGDIAWSSMESAFEGCVNLGYTATDSPDLSGVASMASMFNSAAAFDGNIGGWDVGPVSDMTSMFADITLSTENYDALLSGWSIIDDDESDLQSTVQFSAGNSKFCNTGAKGVLVNEPNSWVITDGGPATGCPQDTIAFITTWVTSTVTESITIPTHSESTYSYNVDWGDGMVNFGYTGTATHTYTTADTYTVSITGDFPRIYFNNEGDKDKIISIDRWGDIAWSSMESAFEGCANLGYTATDSPDLSGVASMASMFNGAAAFDGNIGGWDVGQVSDMTDMFSSVTLSIENYDALLSGWSELPSLQSTVQFSAGNSKYCDQESKNILTGTYLWTITDGGQETDILCGIPYVVMEIPDQSTVVGTDFSYTFPVGTFRNIDADTLTYTAVIETPSTNWLSFFPENRTFSGIPGFNDIGVTMITVTADDGINGIATDTFILTVINRVPTVNAGLKDREAFVGVGFSYSIPSDAFSDDDLMFGDTLAYTANINPQNNWLRFSFSSESRTFSSTPTSTNDIGISTITVTATDFHGGSTSDTFTVTVINRVPAVNAGLASTIVFVGAEFSYEIPETAFSDGDIMYGDTLTYTADINPQDNWFTFSSETRTFTGRPTSTDDIGISTITVTATDLNGGSVNSSFTVTVPNRPPIQIADLTTQVAVVGQRFSYIIPKGAFIDPDDPVDGTLSYSTDENLNWLMFSSATRAFSGNPPSEASTGTHTVLFTVTDPNGGSVNSDFILNVVTVNTPPTLNQALQDQMTYVNRALDYSILENAFIDPDGGSLLYSAEGNPNWLSFDTPTLTFSGTPSTVTDIGITMITVTATDLNGGSTSDTFTVTVVNRVPVVNAGFASTIVFVGEDFSYSIPSDAFSDGDIAFGDTLTYTANINPQGNWLTFSSETRIFTGRPSLIDIGISTITVIATDLSGGSTSGTFTLTVPNRPPEKTDLIPQVAFSQKMFFYQIPEDAFSDPDGGTLLYSAEGNPGWLIFSSGTRTFTGRPSLSDIGIATITVTATDLNNGSVDSSFTLTVFNSPPIQIEDLTTQVAVVGQMFSYQIPENAFSDPDDGSLSYDYTPDESQQWLNFSTGNRTFSGRPTSETSTTGINTVSFTVTDPNGGSLNSNFILNVVTVNMPPTLNPARPLENQMRYVNQALDYSIPENAFSDPDGGSLLYSAEGNPNWLSFDTPTLTFSGTPTSINYIGISTITVTATDLNGGSTSDTFTVTVINRVPAVNAGFASTSVFVGADFSYEIPENAFSDGDIAFGDTLTYTANINPQGNWLTFASETRTFTGRSTSTDIGISTITVTATDRNGGSVNSSFTVTVINRVLAVNAGFASTIVFVGADFSYKIPENAFSDGDITFNNTLAYTANINPQGNWLTFASETRTFTGRPTITDIGISTITVTAMDLNGGSVNSSFTVTVINRIPAVNAGFESTSVFVGADFSYEIPENAFSDGDITFNDTLTYTANINPQGNWLTFASETRTFTGRPSLSDIGISTITVTATDRNGGSVNSSFTVTVVNRVPTVNADLASTSVFVGAEFSYEIPENVFSDDDITFNDTLTYTANINPQGNWLSFDTPTLTFSGTPTNVSDIGISTITVTATDRNGGSVNSSFTVTVVNRVPTVNAGLASTSVFVGADFSYEIPENAFSDGDITFNDTLTYTANINPQGNWLTFSSETRTFTGRSSLSDIGISTITVTAMDLNGGSVNSSFTVTVINRVPTVNEGLKDREAFVGVGFSYSIPSDAFSDDDITFNDTLTYTANINPQGNWLTFSTETRTFTGRPSLSDIGISTITVTATDLNGGSTSDTFTLTVVNRVPTVNAGFASTSVFVGAEFSYEIPENAFSDGDITFNDTLTYTANINPQGNWLTFSTETRTFTGRPSLSDIGISTITVTATDLNGGSVNSSFTVTVVNRVPTVNAGFASTIVFVGAEFSYEIPENAFSDGDITFNDTLTYTANINPQGSWLTFSSETRIFTGRPSLIDIGISTITVTATDLNGGSVNSSFTVTVVNRVPAVNAGLASTIVFVGEDFSYKIPENAFSDGDITFNDTLTYTANINPQGNWLTFASETRTFTGRPSLSDIGISTITVTATDLNGGSVNSSFTVTVPNRPPIQIADLTTQVAVVGQMFSYKIPENAFIDPDDPDSGTLLYSAEGNPGWLMFSTETRTFSGRPPSDTSTGINTVPFTVTDPNGGSVNSDFILNVVTVNTPPTLNPAQALEDQMTYVNRALDYSIPENAFSDPDGGSLFYSAEGNPNWFKFSSETRTFTGRPSLSDIGVSTITVTATDLNGGSVNSSFTVTVPNRPPIQQTANLITEVAVVGQMFSYQIPLGAFIDPDDPDGGTLLYSTDETLNWLMFSSATRTFSGTPTSTDPIGISTVPFTVTDPNGGSVNSDFILNVVTVNTPPTLNQPLENQMRYVNQALNYSIPGNAFSDPDGGSLLYSAEGNPGWLTFSSATRIFSGTPTSTNDIDITTITVTATDLNGSSTSDTFTVTVINRVPTIGTGLKDQEAFIGAEFSYEIPENAFSDGDIAFGDTLTYTANINPQGNWLTFSSETRTFSSTTLPSLSDIGITMITVTATDLNGGSTSDTFTVTVVNRVPTVNAGLESQMIFVGAEFSYEIPENAFSDGDITFNDTLTYTANINPQGSWLTFSSETRIFTGRPSLINIGISTITVTATDLNGGSTSDTFTVTVINRVPAVNAGFESTIVFVGAEFSYEIPENAFSDGDITFNDTLTYTANINPQGNWLSFDTPTLTFSGTPTSVSDIGITTITVTATDRNGGSVNSSFTVTVINRIPAVNAGFESTSVFVGADFSYEIPENAFSDGDITFNDTLTYTANINPQGNWLTFASETRTFTGRPSLIDIGISTITVTATDRNGGNVNSSFTVTVINRVPAVNAGFESTIVFVGAEFSYEIPENAFSDGDITFNDTLTYTANINPQGNWLTFASETRTFTGRPSLSDIGITTITVTATDLNGGSVNSSFTVTVVNRVPTVNEGLKDREAFVGEQFSYEIPENAFRDDDIAFGDTLTYTANINPQGNWLTFSSETRTFTGRPSLSDIGISTITVTATDRNGGSVNSSFTVTVVNRVPTVNAGLASTIVFVGADFSYKIPENAFSDGDITFNDTLTYTANINPQGNWLTFASETRTFTGRPSLSDIGISTITVTATDLNGGSVNSSFTVTVVNRVPAVNAGFESTIVFVGAEFSYEIPENAFSDGDITFNDTLTYTANINPQGSWLTFSSETRTFTGRPSLIDIGITMITVTATDLNGGSVNSSFTVTVVNRVPTVNAGLESTSVFVGADFSYEIPENAFSDGDITFNDTLTYTANINPQGNWLTFSSGTRTFTGRPTSTDIGISTITVTATDRNGGSVTSSFTVTVVNRVPTVNAGLASTSVFVGADFSYEIPENAFSDGDIMYGDTLTYTANINPQGNWLTFSSETRTFTGRPTSTDIGISTITVTATDRNGGSVNSSFTVTVVNRVPTVNAGLASTSVFVGADFSYKILENAFRDDDIMYGDTLTYTANINPQGNWLTFSSETRTFTGRPSLINIGISTITVTATDRNGGSVNSSFTVTVINRVPTVNAGLASTIVFVGEDFSYEIPENAFSDGDITFNDTLTYTANINPQGNWFTFSSETRIFTGSPRLIDIGISTITVTATDLNGGSVNSSFTVTVINRVPAVNAGLASTIVFVGAEFSYEIPENAFSDGDITFNDTLTYTANINPQGSWLTFSSETRIFTGRPSLINIGISTITVTATDLNGGSTSDTFTVTVVNRVPAVNAGFESTIVFVGAEFSYEIPENAFSDGDITFNDTLTYTANINPQGNWLTFASETRTFTGRPSLSDIGISTITVTATDRNGGSVNSSFTVTVVNRVPTVNAGLASTSVFVGADFSYEIPENAFSDGDITFNDTLTYTANINPQGNWLTFASETRTFTGRPSLINIGISTITVTATDLNGGSVNNSFTVTVVNRVPTVNAGLASTSVFVGADFSYEIPENAFSDGDITFNDTLTYTANINPQGNWLAFASETRTFTGRPTSTDIGISTITVTATDRNGGSVNSSFTVTVPNRPPIQIADLTTQVAVVGQRFSYKIPENAFIDPDDPVDGTLSYSTDENLNWLMFSSETRTFSGTPTSTDPIGISTVPFTVTDPNGGSVNSDFILNVVTINTPPTLNPAQALQDQMTYVNQALNYSILENAFSDPDGGSLLYFAEGNPNWLSFDTPTLTFSGTPTDVTDIGITMITVTATDLNGGSTSDTFTVTVGNRVPTVKAGLASTIVFVGADFSYSIPSDAFSDGDIAFGDTLTYTADINPQGNWLTFSSETRIFTGSPRLIDIGISTITVTATDLNGGSVNSSFTVTVPNRPPIQTAGPTTQVAVVGQMFSYKIPEGAFIDPDDPVDGTLLYSTDENLNWLMFSSETRTFSGTPTSTDPIGISTVPFTVTDLNGGSVNSDFILNVVTVNTPPMLNQALQDQMTHVNQALNYPIDEPENAFIDPDGGSLLYSAEGNPNWLSFDTPMLIFSGTPPSINDIGISTITVTATDLNGGSTSDTFTVTVGNRIPTVKAGLASTIVFVGEDFSYKIPETAFSDGDIMYGDTLTYTANINPQDNWLTFSSETRTFTGRPSLSDIGISTITVTATDLNGGSVNSSFTVTVPNRPPIQIADLTHSSRCGRTNVFLSNTLGCFH